MHEGRVKTQCIIVDISIIDSIVTLSLHIGIQTRLGSVGAGVGKEISWGKMAYL